MSKKNFFDYIPVGTSRLLTLKAGLAVLPASKAQKRPVWAGGSKYQTKLPAAEQVGRWFALKRDAMCIVCSKVSGNLEVIDFDQHGELYPKWKEAVPAELFAKLVVEQMQSGGYHATYRCAEEINGNMKLAWGTREAKTVTLIETRGEGGLILCAPGDGYTLIQGDYAHLPVLSNEERITLLMAAWNLNEENVPASTESVPASADDSRSEVRPGDEGCRRGEIAIVLQQCVKLPIVRSGARSSDNGLNVSSAAVVNSQYGIFQ